MICDYDITLKVDLGMADTETREVIRELVCEAARTVLMQARLLMADRRGTAPGVKVLTNDAREEFIRLILYSDPADQR